MKTQPEPDPPGENVPLALAGFLSERRDFITKRWIEAVRRNGTLEAAKQVNDEELADHLPKLFDDLSATLGGKPMAGEAKEDAEAHGLHRWQQQYELEEVLEELGIVSRVLLAHGLDAFADAHPETSKEHLRGARERILRFFEDTAAGSVRQYVERNSQQMREQDLALSEQRRLALDSAQMGSWHFDLESGRIHWDERFKSIFGVADEELSYERVVGLLHPADRENVREAIAAASRPNDFVPYSIEYRVIHPDGSEHWVDAHGRTYFDGEGEARRATSLVGTVRDVTAQRASEEALRAEREMLRTVFDQAPDDAILVMDTDRTLMAWNPAAERITGWTAAEAIGQSADLIFTSEDRAASGPEQEAGIAARDSKAADERWHLRKDGSRFWGSGTLNALHNPSGRVRGYLKVFRDTTARHEETESLAFFRRLTDDLLDHPSPERIIEIVEQRLGEHLQASRVLVTEVSDDGQRVTVQQVWTVPGLKDLTGTYRLADFGPKLIADYAAGRTHVRRDGGQEYPPGTELENIRAVQAIAAIDVPVRIDGHLRFVLAVHQVTPRDWTGRQVTLVQQVADRMAAEVQRARAERALRTKEAASRFLADLGEATRQTTDPDTVLGVVVNALQKHLSADRCVYVEAEQDQDTITIRYEWNNPAGSNRSLAGRYRLSDFGQHMLPTLRSGKTLVIADVSSDPLVADAEAALTAVGVAAAVNVPLVKAGRLVAVLAVHERRPRRWTPDEIALIEAVAERSWGEVERSRDLRALAFERHQVELIFRESPAAMALWRGDDLVFTRVNPEYQDFFRHRQLVGWPLLEACPELADQGFDDLLRQVLHTGKPFTGREVLARIQRDKDGPVEALYFDFTYLQVRDPAGYPWGVYDHTVDVTDRVLNRLALEQSRNDLHESLADREQLLESERAARAEAERVGRMKDEFLATLSHELRTPLNAILGWTQVLRGDPANTEDMESGLATIERNSRAQTQIIEDLLDMSKIISGKVRLDVQSLHLDQVVTAAVDTMRPAAAAKGIRLQALIDPQASMISGDPNRLQQVFWNLLTNAIKFTPKEGKVQVVLERINSHLEVSVADTGEGIAPEFLPYVFDRFRQQDATTTRRHGGLGLGLAIVKQLVELHGGSINVASQGVGHGTTFCVKLPLSAVQPARVEADPERRHPQSEADLAAAVPAELLNLAGIKVLVVDDELDARLLVKRLLEDRQATVHDAGSVREALTLFHAERPDVLVSDIGMPGEDGYSLIHKVRALKAEEGGRTPALALTAYARAEDRLKAVLAGFELHLSKPVSAVELLAFVVKLAGRVGGS